MPELFSVLTYDYQHVENVLDIPETYFPIVTATSPVARATGVYQYGFGLSWRFDAINVSAYLQYRINGGVWLELVKEPKDTTDVFASTLFTTVEVPAPGILLLEVEVRKETAQNQLDIVSAEAYIQRVGDL